MWQCIRWACALCAMAAGGGGARGRGTPQRRPVCLQGAFPAIMSRVICSGCGQRPHHGAAVRHAERHARAVHARGRAPPFGYNCVSMRIANRSWHEPAGTARPCDIADRQSCRQVRAPPRRGGERERSSVRPAAPRAGPSGAAGLWRWLRRPPAPGPRGTSAP